MTVVDSRDPGNRPATKNDPVDETARVLVRRAQSLSRDARSLVVEQRLDESFGTGGAKMADSYRDVAVLFGGVACQLRDEMNHVRTIVKHDGQLDTNDEADGRQ